MKIWQVTVHLAGLDCSAASVACQLDECKRCPASVCTATGGPACARLLGADKVLEATPTMGAEDFSFFGHAGVPASFAFLGSGNAAAGAVHGLHTPQVRLKRLDPTHAVMPITQTLAHELSNGLRYA